MGTRSPKKPTRAQKFPYPDTNKRQKPITPTYFGKKAKGLTVPDLIRPNDERESRGWQEGCQWQFGSFFDFRM